MVIGWVFGIVIGMVLGPTFSYILYHKKTGYGTLLIDRHNPEKEVYRFKVHTDLDELPRKKRIVCKIDPNADLSQD